MRQSKIARKTNETDINLQLILDGKGVAKLESGVGFLDHMLELFAKHSNVDLDLMAIGDVFVDNHHTVEDIGICLGLAIKEALGDKVGIARYSNVFLPMDEALTQTTMDISGRGFLVFNCDFSREMVGDLETEMVQEFFRAVAINAGITLHINLVYGTNNHHIIESIFKGFARAFKQATDIVSNTIPSTKGSL